MGTQVYALCSVNPPGTDPLDVNFARSTDGGLTWSAPVRVNDDAGTGWQWFGTMSTSPSGRIDAIWLDTRDNPGTYLSSLYYSYSTDGGRTWSPLCQHT
jgi:Neuraminidase (sialidase)